jgi:hypothetical protein
MIEVGVELVRVTCFEDLDAVTTSSTSDAHSEQSGQRPTHFGDSYPHDWQTYLVCVLAIAVILPEPAARFNSDRHIRACGLAFDAKSRKLESPKRD